MTEREKSKRLRRVQRQIGKLIVDNGVTCALSVSFYVWVSVCFLLGCVYACVCVYACGRGCMCVCMWACVCACGWVGVYVRIP